MTPRVRRAPAIAVATLFALAVSGWIAFGSVQIGTGWSAGLPRPVRAVIRLADQSMAATGIDAGWRWLAWGGAAVALVGGFALVWLALAAFSEAPSPPDGEVRTGR